MKIKTSEATPLQLNYLVAVCEGWKRELCYLNAEYPAYGSNWSLAGPIIERERINIRPNQSDGDFKAFVIIRPTGLAHRHAGPTPLIAAMRCYVAKELGEEVEIPEELCAN